MDPRVLYFSLYAALTFSFIFPLFTRTARTLIPSLRLATKTSPYGSSRNVRHQPRGFMLHERTKTHPSTTTAQMPMMR